MPVKVKRNAAFVNDVVIKQVKTDENLLRRIAKLRDIPLQQVRSHMRYNVFTVETFALMTGKTVNNIHQKLRGYVKSNGNPAYPLNSCDPFNSLYLKFIHRNKKANDMIDECAGYVYDKTAKHTENEQHDTTQH